MDLKNRRTGKDTPKPLALGLLVCLFLSLYHIYIFVGDSLTTFTFAVYFACIVEFRILKFIRYTQVHLSIYFLIWIPTTQNLEYLLHFYDFFVQIWAWNVINVTHLYMLTKINWLSYLHTKTAKMLQTWQYKVIQRKQNSVHRLN